MYVCMYKKYIFIYLLLNKYVGTYVFVYVHKYLKLYSIRYDKWVEQKPQFSS